jgi:hypothetical protein
MALKQRSRTACLDVHDCYAWARSAAQRKRAHRVAGIAFPDAPKGTCKQCGQAIVHGRFRARSWHDGREDEENCLLAYYVANDRLRSALAPLAERDGPHCQGCGGWCYW